MHVSASRHQATRIGNPPIRIQTCKWRASRPAPPLQWLTMMHVSAACVYAGGCRAQSLALAGALLTDGDGGRSVCEGNGTGTGSRLAQTSVQERGGAGVPPLVGSVLVTARVARARIRGQGKFWGVFYQRFVTEVDTPSTGPALRT